MATPPRLSVVVVAAERSQRFLASWVSFSGAHAHDIEVILVHATSSGMPATTDALRCLECSPGTSVPRLRAAGLRAARGTIVALTEAFCRPAPGWAEALLHARARTGALAIGGPMRRAQGSGSHWALTFAEYGRFLRGEPEGPVLDLPLTNVSYARERLFEILARAPGGLAEDFVEPQVHAALKTAGEALWRTPGAVMFDDNDVGLQSSLPAMYHHGRLYGGRRVEGQRLLVRPLRLALSPLVPLIQLARIVQAASAVHGPLVVVRCLPQLSVLLLAWALGEGVGSLLGAGDSASRWS